MKWSGGKPTTTPRSPTRIAGRALPVSVRGSGVRQASAHAPDMGCVRGFRRIAPPMPARGWGRRGLAPSSSGQDTALSRRLQGFKSPWRHCTGRLLVKVANRGLSIPLRRFESVPVHVTIKGRHTGIGPKGLKRVFVCLSCWGRWIETLGPIYAAITDLPRTCPHCKRPGFPIHWTARPGDLREIQC